MKRHVNLNRLWIALSTVFTIGLIFTYYFLIYVPDNEERITAKKYRTLKRIGQNFVIMKSDYKRSVRQQIWDHLQNETKCKETIDLETRTLELGRLKKKLEDARTASDTASRGPSGIEPIVREIADVDRLVRALRKSEEECLGIRPALERLNLSTIEFASKETFNDRISRPDVLYFFGEQKCTTLELADFIDRQSLIDHFDRFLVVRLFDRAKNEVSKTNLEMTKRPMREMNKKRDSLYAFLAYQGKSYNQAPGSDNKILLGDLQGVFDQSHGLSTIPIRTVQISGIPYRMFSHIVELDRDEDWVLLGLLKEADIKKESRKVQLILIIFMVLGSLFLLLAMPVIKLFVMSPIERLKISNVWFLGFSIVIGTSVAFMMLLVAYHYQTNKTNYEHQLKSLSDKVENHFVAEITAILKQLQKPLYSMEFRHLKSVYPPFFLREKILEDNMYQNDPYPFYNETLLLDNEGNSLFLLATHPVPKRNTITNLKGRQYFENALKKKLDYSIATEERLPPFTMQSILSWNSRAHEAGISIRRPDKYSIRTNTWNPSRDLEVLAIATKLRSVMDPLLPPGYSFCIIDEKGEVLFHSQKDKNLQENFYDESERNKKILAAIQGRLRVSLGIEYGGKKTLAHIRPLSRLPLYLVTLYDQEYYNIPIVFTLSFAIVLISILFLIQGIHLAILFITTYRSSKLQIKRFFLRWLAPHLSDQGQSQPIEATHVPPAGSNLSAMLFHPPTLHIPYRERYLRAILSILIVIASLTTIALLDIVSARVLVFSILTIPVILLTFFFGMLHKDQAATKRFFGASAVLLGLIDFISIPLLEWSVLQVMLVQTAVALVIWIGVWFPAYHPWLTAKLNKLSGKEPLGMSPYIYFLTSWLIMVSVLPILFIYKASHKRESLIWERFIQWETVNLIERRNAMLLSELTRFATETDSRIDYTNLKCHYFSEANHYGSYINLDPHPSDRNDSTKPMYFTNVEEAEFHLRPQADGPLENSRRALLANLHDNPWKWFLKENKLIVKTLTAAGTDQMTEMHTVLQSFKFLTGKYTVHALLFLVVLFITISKLIHSSTKYVFGLGLLSADKISFSKAVDQIVQEILMPSSKYRKFIVGLPYSGKAKFIRAAVAELNKTMRQERIKWPIPFETKQFDFRTDRKLPRFKSDNNILYIIKHFEYGINDETMNELRLKVIEHLEKHADLKIIISSAVEPFLIMEIYEKKIEKLEEASKNEEKDIENIRKHLASLRTSYRKWKHILGGFAVDHISFSSPSATTFKDTELAFGTFLPTLKDRFNPEKGQEEDFVLEVEEAASAYYHALWNSFSRNEKRILFDLAKDQFINLRDIKPIRLLIKKGIIIMDDAPRMMNKSFTNFILSVVGEDEEVAMNIELKQKGTWQTVQLILVITIIGAIAFVALVQQEILSNLNATIATISGVVALLLRFSGFFVGEKVKGTQ